MGSMTDRFFLIFTNSNYIYYESFAFIAREDLCFMRNFISADLMCIGKLHISAVSLLLFALCDCSISGDIWISIGHLDLDLTCGTRRFSVPLSSSLQWLLHWDVSILGNCFDGPCLFPRGSCPAFFNMATFLGENHCLFLLIYNQWNGDSRVRERFCL